MLIISMLISHTWNNGEYFPPNIFLTFRIPWHFGNRMMVGKGEHSKLGTKWKDNWIKPDGRAPTVLLTSLKNWRLQIYMRIYGGCSMGSHPIRTSYSATECMHVSFSFNCNIQLWKSCGDLQFIRAAMSIQIHIKCPTDTGASISNKIHRHHQGIVRHRPLDSYITTDFHIDSITPNYNTESVPTKHRVAILMFSFYIL